jgi:hypothetical protein
MDKGARRLLIRRKLADGSLPYDRIPRVWSGPGNGESCDACEVAITRQELRVEGISREEGGHPILFHAECFHVWDTERRPSGRFRAQPKQPMLVIIARDGCNRHELVQRFAAGPEVEVVLDRRVHERRARDGSRIVQIERRHREHRAYDISVELSSIGWAYARRADDARTGSRPQRPSSSWLPRWWRT